MNNSNVYMTIQKFKYFKVIGIADLNRTIIIRYKNEATNDRILSPHFIHKLGQLQSNLETI